MVQINSYYLTMNNPLWQGGRVIAFRHVEWVESNLCAASMSAIHHLE